MARVPVLVASQPIDRTTQAVDVGQAPLYRHVGVGLLRAAAVPLSSSPAPWPDLADTGSCRRWLDRVWSAFGLPEAIRQASPDLGDRVDALLADPRASAKQVRRAATAVVRYTLRAVGRHTPFGLFAGAAPVTFAAVGEVRWGTSHQAVARADSQWLADVIQRLEGCPELLGRLHVVWTDLAVRRGGRLEAPHGPDRLSLRRTAAVDLVQEAAPSPVPFATLAQVLAARFASADPAKVRGMLTDLVRQGLLITSLPAPLTVIDPLGHLLDRLADVNAHDLHGVAHVLAELRHVHDELRNHNEAEAAGRQDRRAAVERRMRRLSTAGRTPLAVDLALDCQLQVPQHLVAEMQRAAGALARLTRHPSGEPVWRDYFTAFYDRYGTGTLVPLADLVDPDAGLGLPHGYPGSVRPAPAAEMPERDAKLLALAWKAMADGGEVVLDDEVIASLRVGDAAAALRGPPHVELAARVQAASIDALNDGDYSVVVVPGRSAGTFTSRFAALFPESRLSGAYAAVPTMTEGALPVQFSFPPAYRHAENVCRVPAYMPRVLSFGEHRPDDADVIRPDDLAVTATRDALLLVSLSRRRVIEPQAFHALALDKQPPPLARFLAHLTRGVAAAWHEFDWGPQARWLPLLPRVRYGKAILSPARWRLISADLPRAAVADTVWRAALDQWRDRWACPVTVELRDADRSLRLTLDQPAHLALLLAHLERHGEAVLVEAASSAGWGWIGGHAHEIVVPLTSTARPAPSPALEALPLVTNHTHGQLPGAPGSEWLFAKVHTHPERLDELIAEHLPRLLVTLDRPECWFVRYRSRHETDHLRLRLRTPNHASHGDVVAAVGAWAQRLRRRGVTGELVLDTYRPEVGRYGHGEAMRAAEAVFVADSAAVVAQLQHLRRGPCRPEVLAAVNMVATAAGFLGGIEQARRWLLARRVPAVLGADRAAAQQVITMTRDDLLTAPPGWPGEVADAWRTRSAALVHYRTRLPAGLDPDSVLEALLHMHHNRLIGVDPACEAASRRLARTAALASTARS